MDIFTPEYFEKHVATVVPIINVDLLIREKQGRILLSWRDDGMFRGWHFPGRIVRFKEKLEETVVNCWREEIGVLPPWWNINEYFETIRDTEERGHFVTFVAITDAIEIFSVPSFLFLCNGDLKWFDKPPEDLIPEHERYRKYFK